MKSDTYEQAKQKAVKRILKDREDVYILKDERGFYCADELTVCIDLDHRQIFEEVKAEDYL